MHVSRSTVNNRNRVYDFNAETLNVEPQKQCLLLRPLLRRLERASSSLLVEFHDVGPKGDGGHGSMQRNFDSWIFA